MAGSFVLHLTERFGLAAVIRFIVQANGREESLDAIRARMQVVSGVSLEDVESSWLAMVRG